MAEEIKTFVFFDLEGTGLTDNPRITEISLMAIHRLAIQDALVNTGRTVEDLSEYLPRVLNKLTICMYPMKVISSEAASITGLYNDSLLNQKDFDPGLVNLMSAFLCRLEPPVCLVSHNGFRFDFPLLKAELRSIGCDLPEGILCLDTWEMFRSLDGCPVPDRSRFLIASNKTSGIQLKQKLCSEWDPSSEAAKRKKKAECQTVSDCEIFPVVQRMLPEGEAATDKCDMDISLPAKTKPMVGNSDLTNDSVSNEHFNLDHISKPEGVDAKALADAVSVSPLATKTADENKGTEGTSASNKPTLESSADMDAQLPSFSNCNIALDGVMERNSSVKKRLDTDTNVCSKENLSTSEDSKSMISGPDYNRINCSFVSDSKTLALSQKDKSKEESEKDGTSPLCKKNLFPDGGDRAFTDSESSLCSLTLQTQIGNMLANGQSNHHHNFFSKPKRLSYRLAEIHLRVLGCYPSRAHRAEDDCLALAHIFMFTPNSPQWADVHAVPFADFHPMYNSPRKPLQPGYFPVHFAFK